MTFPPFPRGPGKVQTQPRPHQVVIDPTSHFMLVPDLGADRIRVLKIVKCGDILAEAQECSGVDLPKGSFPRHVAFATLEDRTMLYLFNQDICSLLTYRVDYLPDNQGLSFHKHGQDIDLMQRLERIVQHPADARILASHLAISVSLESRTHSP
jgi:6-phosphogluconolactonase (cycloisomerase 2 family)